MKHESASFYVIPDTPAPIIPESRHFIGNDSQRSGQFHLARKAEDAELCFIVKR